MKKWWATIVCVCLLLPLAVIGAADNTVGIVSSGLDNEVWQVTWDNPLATLVQADIGGRALTAATTGETDAQIDVSALPFGSYAVSYLFSFEDGTTVTADDPNTLIRTGSTEVVLTMTVTESGVSVTATDRFGEPVVGATLHLSLDGTIRFLSAVTDDSGAVMFAVNVPAGNNIPVQVEFDGMTTEGGITYEASTVSEILNPVSDSTETTPSSDPTETGESTEPTEETTATRELPTTGVTLPTLPSGGAITSDPTAPTYATVRGDMSTDKRQDRVVSNVITDTNLLSLFGGNIDTFNGKARMYLSAADYDALTATYGGTALAAVYTSPLSPTAAQIEQSRAQAADLSDCAGSKTQAMTFQLSLQFVSPDAVDLFVDDAEASGSILYTLELPVPAAMQNCTVFGVAMIGEDSMTPLTRVAARGGTITFTAPTLGHFALIGFENGAAVHTASTSSPLKTLFIVLLTAGILLLAGTGVLIYFFFIRKRPAIDLPAESESVLLGDLSADTVDRRDNALQPGATDQPPKDTPAQFPLSDD